ncbi:AzlD domain-containing protein [Goodfellowiella coeruleoviolacea]|uniref:Branched-chain amino acid transport protein (AzlD) n=1 Tax=Goodfellowiella coeruleoviolacea TaxID=334858 RepID=A0AAE3GFV0_9PSEU|nr:AzlD domain-containing protein [Goodfellowiella coeruleoviolacea]MCP2166617.1 Branched-chain amino acid transport protein (AzlD) [Goodfellowiella coeruleoviolacea]
MTLAAVLVLALGTYGLRLAGPLLRDRVRLSERVTRVLAVAATTLLTALIATAALTSGSGYAGWSLPAGVLVGGLAAWRRLPFVVVVVLAAATTAVLRLLGAP